MSNIQKILLALICLTPLKLFGQYIDYIGITDPAKYLLYEFYYDDVWKKDFELMKANRVSQVKILDYGNVKFLSMDINKEGYISSYRFHGEHLQSKGRFYCGITPDSMLVFYDEQNRIIQLKCIPLPWGFGYIEYNFTYENDNLIRVNTKQERYEQTDSIFYENEVVRRIVYDKKAYKWPVSFFTTNKGQPNPMNYTGSDIDGIYNPDYNVLSLRKDSLLFKYDNGGIFGRVLKKDRIHIEFADLNQAFPGGKYEYVYKPDGLIQYVKITDRLGDKHTRFYEYEYYSE